MYILSNEEMKQAERQAMDKGIPSIILMENAARGAAEVITQQSPQKVIVFAGKGNNGGDGLAIARMLITKGIDTDIVFIGDKEKATPDCRTNLTILENYNANISYSYNNTDIKKYDVTVDALIGTGLSRKLSENYVDIVNTINKSRFIVSVDCPTGVNSDTGEVYDTAVKADITVTFHLPKTGLLLLPGILYTGRLVVKDIGAPYTDEYNTFTLTQPQKLMPLRKSDSNKGTYGKVLFVSGCDTMAGAAVINGTSAYRAGCGLVNICSTKHVISVIHNTLPEAVTTLREDIDIDYGTVTAIGSGLSQSEESRKIVEYTLTNSKVPVIADADALNIISQREDLKKHTSLITPHIKEMSRLTGLSTEYIKSNMISTALDYAKKYNTVVLLKDAVSIIASPSGKVCINTTGTPAMSKGGSGDSLTGVTAGLAAQGLDMFTSACLGAYINGRAGEIAEKIKGPYSVTALDISSSIPEAINTL